MKTLSRWMQPLSPPPEPGWKLVLLYMLGMAAMVVAVRTYLRWPFALVAALLGVLVYLGVFASRSRRLAREAEARHSEDIGTFAQTFDRRSANFDPWVLRATWDALAPWTEVHSKVTPGRRLPVRPSDDLAKVLGIAGNDVEAVVEEVAIRSGRLLDDASTNLHRGRVRTVGDLVSFVSHQPRRPAA